MKILHILDHSLPLHSGYTFRSQSIFREQRERGWIPVILTSPKHEQSWKGQWIPLEEINGFPYYRTGAVTGNLIPGTEEIKIMRALAKRIEQVVRIENPDILHAHSPVLNALPALWVGRKCKIPVVYEIRAFWEDAAVDHGTYAESSAKYRLTQKIETWVCRRVHQVAILCEGLKTDLIQRGIAGEKITIVYNGVNPEDFSENITGHNLKEKWNLSGKKVIGFVGSFYRYEGLDMLIRAFSGIARKREDIRLLLVGGGEVIKELEQLTDQLKLRDLVIMPGRVPHQQIADVYSIIDILVYPRQSIRLTNLVTPLKPLEAMAMAKVVVASDVGGHKELIKHGETGLLFRAGDVNDLEAVLLSLLENEVLRTNLRMRGKGWVVNNHTWGKTTSVYREIYDRALQGKTLTG